MPIPRNTDNVWQGIAQSLMILNSWKEPGRILVVRKSEDPTTEYDAALSCMLAAEKIGVAIDGLSLGDCQLLHNASEFTGGVFVKHVGPNMM